MKKESGTPTLKEIEELEQWFKEQKQNLPATMQIDSGVYTPDLSNTVRMLLEQTRICYKNPKMQGCIRLLKKIRQNILESGN